MAGVDKDEDSFIGFEEFVECLSALSNRRPKATS